MTDRIIGGSLLILLLAALRPLLRGRVRPAVQYALWLLVAARLLLPTLPIESAISALGRMEQSETVQEVVEQAEETILPYVSYSVEMQPGETISNYAPVIQEYDHYVTNYSHNPNGTLRLLEAKTVWELPVWRHIWWAGIVLMALWMAVQNLLLQRRMRRSRRKLEVKSALPVYTVDGIPSPFLMGLLRPVIYLPAGEYDEKALRHILAHEETHWRHDDHIWAYLRGICLAVHWFNPLVWWAAALSRRDGELACDDGAVRRLGEEEAKEYGYTLLSLVTAKPRPADLLCTATTMSGGKASLKERIRMLAKRPKTLAVAVAVLVLAVSVGMVASFTRGSTPGVPVQLADLNCFGEYVAEKDAVEYSGLSYVPRKGWKLQLEAGHFIIERDGIREVYWRGPVYEQIPYEPPTYLGGDPMEAYGSVTAFRVSSLWSEETFELWIADGSLFLVENVDEDRKMGFRIWELTKVAKSSDLSDYYGTYAADGFPRTNLLSSTLGAYGWKAEITEDLFFCLTSTGLTVQQPNPVYEQIEYRPKIFQVGGDMMADYNITAAYRVSDHGGQELCQLWITEGGSLFLVENYHDEINCRAWRLVPPGQVEPMQWEVYDQQTIDALFWTAQTAYSWFDTAQMPVHADVSFTDEKGVKWYAVDHAALNTMANLRDYLKTFFAPEFAEDLLNRGCFREVDGVLYTHDLPHRATSPYAGAHKMSHFGYSGRDGGVITVTVDVLDEDLTTVLGQQEFRYEYLRADHGGYVLSWFYPWDGVFPQPFHQAKDLYDLWNGSGKPAQWLPLVDCVDWNFFRQVASDYRSGVHVGGDNAMSDIMGDLYDYAAGLTDPTEEQLTALMRGTAGLDGAWSEGYGHMLYLLYEKNPARFVACLNALEDDWDVRVKSFLRFELGYAMGRGSLTEEELEVMLRQVSGATPEVPYLAVYLISPTTGERVVYLPLTEKQAEATRQEPLVKPEGGFAATLYLKNGESVFYSDAQGVPQSVIDLAVEKCGYIFENTEDVGTVVSATLDCSWLDFPLSLDESNLSELERMLKQAEYGYVGRCGYGAKLNLTFADGRTMTVYKGTDDCDTLVFGSWGGYFLGDRENIEFWTMFGLDPSTKNPFGNFGTEERWSLYVGSQRLSLRNRWEEPPWRFLNALDWQESSYPADTYGIVYQAESDGLTLKALKDESDGSTFLIEMKATSRDFVTADGLRVGDRKAKLLEVYGGNTAAEGELVDVNNGRTYLLKPPQNGHDLPHGFLYISFEIGSDKNISAITIYNGLDG